MDEQKKREEKRCTRGRREESGQGMRERGRLVQRKDDGRAANQRRLPFLERSATVNVLMAISGPRMTMSM